MLFVHTQRHSPLLQRNDSIVLSPLLFSRQMGRHRLRRRPPVEILLYLAFLDLESYRADVLVAGLEESLAREELDSYLTHQLKAAGVSQPLFDDIARQALYQATKGILRKVNKLALTALRLAASRKESIVGESILLDATTEALL